MRAASHSSTLCLRLSSLGHACGRLLRRRLLREEFQSGRLKSAASKAELLEDLCERLKYDPDAATEVHKGIYTERIEKFLEDEKLTGAPPPPPPPPAGGGALACTGLPLPS